MFVVPIAFFSIFALIFGGGLGPGTTPKIKMVVVDEVDSDSSRAVVGALKENVGLRFMRREDPASLTRAEASEMVRRGSLAVAVVLSQPDDLLEADLLSDSSDQVAGQVVTSLVAKSLMIAESRQRAKQLVSMARPATRNRTQASDTGSSSASAISAAPDSGQSEMPTELADRVKVIDVIGQGKSNPVVSVYAAGIAVMFLLFGATGGGGVFLEERENQTLDRLLSTQLSMDQLLLGKWFYMTALGVLQVGVMFAWAQVVFGVDLLGHFDGFVVMTVVTASAASAFGLFLATLCKTRGQLNGLSVILVLSMSALGGSMVPRYVMSDQLRQYGLWTFNAWALDGYDKVFWRELPVSALAPQMSVLLISGFLFLVAARVLALRWETD